MTTADDLIAFKGDRNYLQGPDILNRLAAFMLSSAAARSMTDIRFAAHGFIDTNAVVLKSFAALEDIGEGEWPSTMTAMVDGRSQVVAMKQGKPGPAVQLRVPFDEAALQRAMQVDGERILFSAPLPVSLVELAVSMKKKLMQTLFPAENVKWVFVRADLATWQTSVAADVCVTCRTRAPGRIYRSSVAVDGVEIGTLYFIGIKQ